MTRTSSSRVPAPAGAGTAAGTARAASAGPAAPELRASGLRLAYDDRVVVEDLDMRARHLPSGADPSASACPLTGAGLGGRAREGFD